MSHRASFAVPALARAPNTVKPPSRSAGGSPPMTSVWFTEALMLDSWARSQTPAWRAEAASSA